MKILSKVETVLLVEVLIPESSDLLDKHRGLMVKKSPWRPRQHGCISCAQLCVKCVSHILSSRPHPGPKTVP